jgi:predicted N-acyltransferase
MDMPPQAPRIPKYSEKLFNSIREVPVDPWQLLAKDHSCTYSLEFWEVLEGAELNDFCYTYVLIYDENESPVALTCFYSVTLDLAELSSGWRKKALAQIREVIPGFLKIRILECGTPVAMNRPFLVKAGCDEGEILKHIGSLLMDIAKKQGQFLVVMRDFEPGCGHLESSLKELDFHMVESFPNTYLGITWPTFGEYLASMRKNYRRRALVCIKSHEDRGFHCELRDDFDELADVLCAQWMAVHEKAKELRREKLTADFYRNLSRKLGARSKVLLFFREGERVGHTLLLVDGDKLRAMYVGRNESIKDDLYFYMNYKTVETAIHMKMKCVEFGLTTYEPKLYMGAELSPIHIAIQTARVSNRFTGFVYSLLKRMPQIKNRHVFKRPKEAAVAGQT